MARTRVLLGVPALALALALALVAQSGRPAAALGDRAALSTAGRWLVDGDGRVVILHGVNQVRKLPPYLPSAIGFGEDDARYIASQGFNTVRTGVIHKGLAPAPGTYDVDYLADFLGTVDTLVDAGLYVLVDFHQDMYNERYQGEGFADWATVDSWPADPSTTVPNCMAGFPGNLFACEFLWEANDRFFGISGRPLEPSPRGGGLTLQDEFAEAWTPLAEALRGNPLVFGYNILNEPTPGSQTLACLEPAGCPPDTDAQLREFSNKLALAIRDIDPDTIVFYEPWATNFNAGFPTYHGDLDVGNVALSFHVYACPFAIPGVPVPDPGASDECDTIREQTVFDNAEGQATKYGHPGVVTEFGATDDIGTIERIAGLADDNMVGWQYWAWWNEDPCCARPDEGIIDDPANPPTPEHLDQPKLDALVRAYPRAVAGTPTSWSWDGTAKRFELAYDVAPAGDALAPGAQTEVWVPRRHYPEGYDVIELAGGDVVSALDAERLHVRNRPGASQVSFAVVPASDPRPGVEVGEGEEIPAPDPGPADGPTPITGGGAALIGVVLLGLASARRRR